MGGLGFLLVIALYIAGANFVVKRVPTRWGKALVVLVFVLIPTADALYGRYVKLPELCKDAGVTVFKKASKEGGLMTWSPSPDAHWINAIGIAFVEGTVGPYGSSARISMVDGKPVLELSVIPKSRYRMSEQVRLNSPFGDNYVGDEIRIEDRISGEILSQYREYGFNGGWAERFLGHFAGSGPQGGASCPPTANRVDLLVRNTFN